MPNRNEWLLAAWLENRLTQEERREFETLCQENNDFAAQVELANQSIMLAQDYEPVPVPNWDKDASFLAPPKVSWWQWQGFPVASMAMSIFAVCLVVFNIEFRFEDNGMMISFAGQNEQQKLEQQQKALIAKQAALKQKLQQQESERILLARKKVITKYILVST